MIWARYTDSELLWLFDTPRKKELLGTELISIQGLLHVGLNCNNIWSAGPEPGDQQHRAWLGTWPRGGGGGGGLICVCLAKVRTVKHPTIVSGLRSLIYRSYARYQTRIKTHPLPEYWAWKQHPSQTEIVKNIPLRASDPQYTKSTYSQRPRPHPRCELRIPRVFESNRCNTVRKGLWERTTLGRRYFFPPTL